MYGYHEYVQIQIIAANYFEIVFLDAKALNNK